MEQMRIRLAAILAELEAFAAIESMSDEQMTDFDALSTEFESLKKNIEAKEKLAAIQASANVSQRQVLPRTEVAATRIEKMNGFKSMGEFLMSVKNASSGNIDKRFLNSVAYEKNGEDGGFLVPEEMMSDIAKKLASDESLLAKTRQLTVSGNTLTLPTDENAPWNGGVQAYWTAEGAVISESKPAFGLASWRLNKLAAMVKTTDELLDDAQALESYIRVMAPGAIMHKINSAILSGDGVGKPLGILNSGFKIKVSKEAGPQTADTIVARNVIKMYSRMIPSSRGNAAWYINAGCEEQLRTMKDDLGNFIYMAAGSQMNQGPYALLLGRPVIPLLGGMKALGDEGDIIFADLSYMYAIVKAGGMKSAISTHLYFDRDQTAFKWTLRLDAACPFKSPVTTEFGSYQMSGFVTLEDR